MAERATPLMTVGDRGSEPARGASIGAPALAALGVIAPAVATWGYAVDDAWIVARYARRIAAGLGYTFVDGPPTDGVTGPASLLPALAAELALGDPMLGQRLVGLVASLAAAWLAVRWAAAEGRAEAWITAAWIAACPLLGIWAAAGLETGLATLAFTAMCLSAERRSGLWTGLSVAALAWLRPEAAPAALVALVTLRGAPRRDLAMAWGLAVAGALSVVAFRLAMFGAPLPLSAAAKPPDLAHGLEYTGRAALVLFGGLGVVAVAMGATGAGRRGVGGILLAHAAAVVLAGGDWMPGFRLYVPMVPAAAWVAAGAIAPRIRRPAGALLLAGSLALPLVGGGLAVMDARAATESRETEGRALAAWLRDHAERVALVDVGYLAFASGVDVVDLGGITDPAIGRLPGGHAAKAIDPGVLAARAPDVIVLHSTLPPRVERGRLTGLAGHPVERRVAEMAWVRRELQVVRTVRYAPAYLYVVLARSPERPNDGRLQP